MRTTAIRLAGVASLGALMALASACGSASKSSSTTADAAAVQPDTTQPAQPASDATNAPSGGSSNPQTVQLGVQNATYTTARVHVEFGGDGSGNIEADGTGSVISGFANLAFGDAASQFSAIFVFGGDQPSAVSFGYEGMTSGGEFGKECTVDVTKADETALEGTFDCSHMAGVSASATDLQSVDAKGYFRLAA